MKSLELRKLELIIESMKKYILSSLAVLTAATMFTSCDDMLDTDPRVTSATQATFPGKIGDVEALQPIVS